MNVSVFKRIVQGRNGISFPVYTAKLTKKTGENVFARCHFNKSCKIPESFPTVIKVEQGDANTSTTTYTGKDGAEHEQLHLWIKNYSSEEHYIDHVLDDFI